MLMCLSCARGRDCVCWCPIHSTLLRSTHRRSGEVSDGEEDEEVDGRRNMRECEIKYFCNWCFACSNEENIHIYHTNEREKKNLFFFDTRKKSEKNAEKESFSMSYG